MTNIDIREYLIPIMVAFGLAVILGPMVIPTLRRLKFGQSIREEGPQAHLKKAGTPTMGGVIILIALVLTALPFSSYFLYRDSGSEKFVNADLFILLFATAGYGIIGFLDDYIKVVMKRSLGLTASQKLLGQLFIAVVVFAVLLNVRYLNTQDLAGASKAIFSVNVPGIGTYFINWLYLPFLVLLLVGFSNALNLTDGLDGLLSSTAVMAYGAYAVIGIWQGNQTVYLFAFSVIGALLGFLVFNAHPAKVFMGDTGSLALGGGLAALAIITKTEFLLPLIGIVFVVETLSVILQVLSFKFRKKRIFKMSPLHHHFELIGWSEWKIVAVFSLVGLICGALGVFFEIALLHPGGGK
ncbi:phospho-N-acetylmuramoyl-pentapeptide-transferase [Croceifilum oryzae]|uniref:Phospho-N-acetylmuramoyl-pentapeptide-transferase n=1 Tax=Croceifilum oryzae TaxID=1553429 RepID=A0AAJ1TD84_9BACL|nr:phospho-N-acetylmuramoyl-pentapeptide-transferase [Croceifilum oryzae]MDQ0416384.1 phospho-N-acetylmuramoyl-pentapeptide-transferase [Croceifilum oryzae]